MKKTNDTNRYHTNHVHFRIPHAEFNNYRQAKYSTFTALMELSATERDAILGFLG